MAKTTLTLRLTFESDSENVDEIKAAAMRTLTDPQWAKGPFATTENMDEVFLVPEETEETS